MIRWHDKLYVKNIKAQEQEHICLIFDAWEKEAEAEKQKHTAKKPWKKPTKRAVKKPKKEELQFVKDIFFLCMASTESDLFDIIEATEFFLPSGDKSFKTVIGMARGKEEALLLASAVVDEIYRETGGLSVRTYFETGSSKAE